MARPLRTAPIVGWLFELDGTVRGSAGGVDEDVAVPIEIAVFYDLKPSAPGPNGITSTTVGLRGGDLFRRYGYESLNGITRLGASWLMRRAANQAMRTLTG